MKWPWKRVPVSQEPQPNALGRLDDLERRFRGLEQEWLDWLERGNRVLGRLAKRADREAAPAPAPDDEPVRPPPNGTLDPVMLRRSGRARPGGS